MCQKLIFQFWNGSVCQTRPNLTVLCVPTNLSEPTLSDRTKKNFRMSDGATLKLLGNRYFWKIAICRKSSFWKIVVSWKIVIFDSARKTIQKCPTCTMWRMKKTARNSWTFIWNEREKKLKSSISSGPMRKNPNGKRANEKNARQNRSGLFFVEFFFWSKVGNFEISLEKSFLW